MNRNRLGVVAITFAAAVFGSATAHGLSFSAEFNLANSVIANPVTVNVANRIALDLTPGDIFALNVIVENVPGDTLTAVFASLVVDGTQLQFLGGAYSDILIEESCTGPMCSPAALSPGIPSPIAKPSQPFHLATGTSYWIQAIAHTNVNGASGTGPDSGLILAFQYAGLGGYAPLEFATALTAGDAIGGNVTSPINFSGAYINVPEPGVAILLGLGLAAMSASKRSVVRVSEQSRA